LSANSVPCFTATVCTYTAAVEVCVTRYSSNEEQYILTRQIPHGYKTYLFVSKTGGTVERKGEGVIL